jgi:uncharacterized protein (TIGR02266 family)
MDRERRAHPRFPLILAVQYVGAETVLDYTENLSAGGLFIRTEREFSPGERVPLVVSFPQLLEPVELTAEVTRHRPASPGSPAGVAVRVPEDLVEDRARLAEVARRLAGGHRGGASFRILLVEDNALVASMYAAALRRMSETDHLTGLCIEVATDGASAFDRLLRAPPIDVVVTDVFMPVLSGISMVEKIRAEPSLAHLPVVVITSGGDAERDRLAALGVREFLRKPVSYQDLAGAVRAIREGRARPPASAEEPRREQLPVRAPMPTSPSDAKPASRR